MITMGIKNTRIYTHVCNRYDEAYSPNKVYSWLVSTADNHYDISGGELLDLSYYKR